MTGATIELDSTECMAPVIEPHQHLAAFVLLTAFTLCKVAVAIGLQLTHEHDVALKCIHIVLNCCCPVKSVCKVDWTQVTAFTLGRIAAALELATRHVVPLKSITLC